MGDHRVGDLGVGRQHGGGLGELVAAAAVVVAVAADQCQFVHHERDGGHPSVVLRHAHQCDAASGGCPADTGRERGVGARCLNGDVVLPTRSPGAETFTSCPLVFMAGLEIDDESHRPGRRHCQQPDAATTDDQHPVPGNGRNLLQRMPTHGKWLDQRGIGHRKASR